VVRDAAFVAVVGGANVDVHGRPAKPLRAGDSNPGTVHVSAGGVARNVAENLARLGIDCRLVSAIGDDHHGEMLLRLSREAGIDTRHVHTVANAATATYLSVLDESGDLEVAISDMRVLDELEAWHLEQCRPMLSASRLVVIDANLSDGALGWLTRELHDTPVFADTVSASKAPRLRPFLESIHTLKTSTIEVEALTGAPARTAEELQQVVRQLHAEGVDRVFVTRGRQGVFYGTAGAEGVVDYRGRERAVENAGGAGDAFLAGLVYAWLQCWPLGQSLEFALAIAELTLAHPSTCNPGVSLHAVGHILEARRAG
jgi:pseudouridine kinase